MSEGFMLDARMAMLFFRFCRIHHIDRLDDRIALARVLVKRKKAKYVRSVDEFTKGKAVLRITRKKEIE